MDRRLRFRVGCRLVERSCVWGFRLQDLGALGLGFRGFWEAYEHQHWKLWPFCQ